MEGSKKEIMEATFSAVRKHSYSELSVQNIADEFDKSKSLLYHHYEGKDEILLDFLDYILESFKEEAFNPHTEDSSEEFEARAFMAFRGQDCELIKTLVELRTQGIRDKRFRKKFDSLDKHYRNRLEELLEEGREEGKFKQELEPREVAAFIAAVNHEAMNRFAAGSDNDLIEEEMKNYLESRVYK